MNPLRVAIYILLFLATWVLVEIGYRIAIGIGPIDELTGYDFFLIPLHIAGIASSIGLGRWIERGLRKR